MLDTTSRAMPAIPAPPVLRGKSLAHTHLTACQRALLAAAWRGGQLELGSPTRKQARSIFGVPEPLIRAAELASPADLRKIEHGEVKLSHLIALDTAFKNSTDTELMTALAAHGDRVLPVLDKLTAPPAADWWPA